MKKILFGITSLTVGGAERVLVDLVNRLVQNYDITIYTIYDDGALKTQLDDRIKTISLCDREFKEYSKIQVLMISLKLIFSVKPPEGYDTYISFLEGPITRLFSKKISKKEKNKNIGIAKATNTIESSEEEYNDSIDEIKKIAWVHNDISKVFGHGLISKIKKFFDKRVYKKYNKIIFVSRENQKDFNNTYGSNFDEKVIRNYLDYNRVLEKANEDIDVPFESNDINLLTVCRLEEQKAIERFINVHAKLEREGIHCKVFIVGNGTQRYALQRQIDKLNETDKFYLLGEKKNPYPYIKKCDYFCLFSYYEGYGMVLDEAKILNKPIMITDTAARESVENYDKAIIVENTEKGILEGIKEEIRKYENKENEYSTISESKDNINEYYDKIIDEVERIIK